MPAMILGQQAGRALLLRVSSSRQFLSRYSLKAPVATRIISRLSSFNPSFTREYARRTGGESPSQKPNSKESIILEKFKLRQLRGSSAANGQVTSTQKEWRPKSPEEEQSRAGEDNEKTVVWGFEQLGMDSAEVKEAMEEMGVFVPSEIQCVGIPRILEGKSLVLSSSSGSGRTLAYLLPLLQLMSRHHGITGARSWHPQAIVLCATEDLSDQVFQMAKFIHGYTKKKKKLKMEGGVEESGDAPIGLLVGTPVEIPEQIEEGYVAVDSLKYLVLDDADYMLASGFNHEIRGIINKTKDNDLQSILITSQLTKLLDETYLENFERDHAGKVSAMFLELQTSELFQLTQSLEALSNGVQEAIDSLSLTTDSTPTLGK